MKLTYLDERAGVVARVPGQESNVVIEGVVEEVKFWF